MNDRGEGSILGRLAYAAGYALGRADTLLEGDEPSAAEPSAPTPTAYPAAPPNDREATYGEEPAAATGTAYEPISEATEDGGQSAVIALGTIAAGWLLGRIIRPRPVNWPRAVLAGVAGTALADLTGVFSRQDSERPATFPPGLEDIPRYAAGVATAAAYGSQVYPRLPGSSLTRGLIFGTVEAMVAENGGALGMLQRVAPQLRLPLDSLGAYAAPRRSTIASLAFGLGLGLYSARGKRR
jgi:hypothetical protein